MIVIENGRKDWIKMGECARPYSLTLHLQKMHEMRQAIVFENWKKGSNRKRMCVCMCSVCAVSVCSLNLSVW
jgi:hypothetical protein